MRQRCERGTHFAPRLGGFGSRCHLTAESVAVVRKLLLRYLPYLSPKDWPRSLLYRPDARAVHRAWPTHSLTACGPGDEVQRGRLSLCLKSDLKSDLKSELKTVPPYPPSGERGDGFHRHHGRSSSELSFVYSRSSTVFPNLDRSIFWHCRTKSGSSKMNVTPCIES